MNKANEIYVTHDIVKEILETYELARNSDMALYVKVCEKVNPAVLSKPFWVVLLSLKEYNLPCIETVRRTRQRLQATYPELSGNANVEGQRVINEEAFCNYAKGCM